jgi:hypothetical protein
MAIWERERDRPIHAAVDMSNIGPVAAAPRAQTDHDIMNPERKKNSLY